MAGIAIPTVFLATYAGGWIFAGVIALMGALGAEEVFRLAETKNVRALRGAGYVGAGMIPALTYMYITNRMEPGLIWMAAVIWFIALMLNALAARTPEDAPLASIATTIFGVLYCSGLLSSIIVLREQQFLPGRLPAVWFVFLPLATTWICDSLAMAGGGTIGGPKLAPRVSPGKTWSGAISGWAGAILVPPLYAYLILGPAGVNLDLPVLLILGAVIGVIGQLGDLVESLIKREAGVKDSGSFFPGHGGVLDRLDSLYWVLPSTVVVFSLLGVI